MPNVVGHTPPWLSHPSPGARIFSDPEAQSPASPVKKAGGDSAEENSNAAVRRVIAHRGSEVFTVVGNKIRWADLASVKAEWDEQQQGTSAQPRRGDDRTYKKAYRTFKTPVYYQITSLTVSPSGHFLAISTEHTVHVALLPDSSRLHDGDTSEIRLRTHHLGPTTHVIPEAALAAVLWHPLAASSASSDCLITVSIEAVVRIWELEHTDRWSFERPALAIDLRKLANGTSSDQDFEPSGFGRSRGFSVDAFDMEAAAACFGGRGAENEDPWAATTLWTTMTNGDVYALCPLLPSKWKPSPTTIPALTTSTVSKASIPIQDSDPDERKAAEQRFEWVQELDNDHADFRGTGDDSIRLRPSVPSIIPRLQGPFQLFVDDMTEEAEVSDILVIPANLDEEELFSGEDDYLMLGNPRSLPFSVVCLTTTNHQLHLMIGLEGVAGQWLPSKGRNHFSTPTWDAGDLVPLETVSLDAEIQSLASPPMFTSDPANPYHFFVTAGASVFSFSLDAWAGRVASEVTDIASDPVDTGLLSRLKVLCQGPVCIKEDLITQQELESPAQALLSAAVLIEDVYLGSLVLASSNGRIVAAQLDPTSYQTSIAPTNEPLLSASTSSPFRASQSLMQVLHTEAEPAMHPPPTRAPYAPPQIFYQDHMAAIDQIKGRIPNHRRSMLTENPLRLSPACLDVMTLAHRTFSTRTSAVETAAAELFRRCERLRQELVGQLRQMAELAQRLSTSNSGDEDEDEVNTANQDKITHSEKISNRIDAAKTRQKELFSRYERLRRKAGQVGHANQDLSIKERAWIQETDSLAAHVGVDPGAVPKSTSSRTEDTSLDSRLASAKSFVQDLVIEAKKIKDQVNTEEADRDGGQSTPDGKLTTRLGGSGGLSRFQREKIREVMEMVEREAAVIEAVQGRLSRLSV